MKRSSLIISEILRDQRQELSLCAAIYLTVTVCFLSIFICFRVVEQDKLVLEDAAAAERSFGEQHIDAGSFSSFAELEDALKSAMEKYVESIDHIRFQTDDMPLYTEYEAMGRLTVGVEIAFEGIAPGEIHVGEDVLYQGEPLAVGDKCELFGKSFTVTEVGDITAISADDLSELDAPSMFGFFISAYDLVTKSALTEYERDDLAFMLKLKGSLVSERETAEEQNSSLSADQKLICILISALSVLVILTLFKQAMLRCAPRIALFRLCGAKNGFVSTFFITYLLVYMIVPFAAALGIDQLLGGVLSGFYLEHDAPFSLKIFALVLVAVMSLMFTLPQLMGIVKKQPAELAVRR